VPALDGHDPERIAPTAVRRFADRDLPRRQAVADGELEGPDERLEPRAAPGSLDDLAAERIRTIEEPDLAATSGGDLGGPDRRRDVGVIARPDVLQIDQEEVDSGEDLGGRSQGGERVAIERVDRHPRPRVEAFVRRDHVLLDAVVAVLRSK
jgi:hypothetical protein